MVHQLSSLNTELLKPNQGALDRHASVTSRNDPFCPLKGKGDTENHLMTCAIWSPGLSCVHTSSWLMDYGRQASGGVLGALLPLLCGAGTTHTHTTVYLLGLKSLSYFRISYSNISFVDKNNFFKGNPAHRH